MLQRSLSHNCSTPKLTPPLRLPAAWVVLPQHETNNAHSGPASSRSEVAWERCSLLPPRRARPIQPCLLHLGSDSSSWNATRLGYERLDFVAYLHLVSTIFHSTGLGTRVDTASSLIRCSILRRPYRSKPLCPPTTGVLHFAAWLPFLSIKSNLPSCDVSLRLL